MGITCAHDCFNDNEASSHTKKHSMDSKSDVKEILITSSIFSTVTTSSTTSAFNDIPTYQPHNASSVDTHPEDTVNEHTRRSNQNLAASKHTQSDDESDNESDNEIDHESEHGSNHTCTYTQTWCDNPKSDDDSRCISISSTLGTTPSPKSIFNDMNHNENVIDIPSYQLQNTVSIDADLDDPVNAFTQTVESNQSPFTIKYAPNLYRPDTTTSWDLSDIDDLQDDMKEQLLSLQVSMVPDTIGTFDGLESESKVTNLVQDLSCDWDSEIMESEEDHMKKHLMHLQTTQSYSSSASMSRMHSL